MSLAEVAANEPKKSADPTVSSASDRFDVKGSVQGEFCVPGRRRVRVWEAQHVSSSLLLHWLMDSPKEAAHGVRALQLFLGSVGDQDMV